MSLRPMTGSGVHSPLLLEAQRIEEAPLSIETGGAAAAQNGESLLERLARALEAQRVPYCQWKGHWSAHRWTAGLGDVDLLVAHDARVAFRRVVDDLGFKPASPPLGRQIPGVESYFGRDPEVTRPLHLHVHYRLVLGEPWRHTYRLPLERLLVTATVPGRIFPAPGPAHLFLIFVLRMMLLQRGRPLLSLGAGWRRSIQIQLDNLEAMADRETLVELLQRHLPAIDPALFDRCLASLRGRSSLLERLLLPEELHRRLREHAHRPSFGAQLSAVLEKTLPLSLRRLVYDERARLSGGGIIIALVGGDGAGKSTCTRLLGEWLSPHFPTRCAHLGLPRRSLTTLLVGGALKAEQLLRRLRRRESSGPTHLELLRYLCTARDCFGLYQRVRRFTAGGGIAICDRYPISQLRTHVGPSIPALLPSRPTRLARLIRSAEVSYYERILPPDALFVLRLDPDVAVQRKPDEPAEYVRTRGRVVWETDWTTTTAQVVDVNRPLDEVMEELRSLVWSAL